MPFLEHIAGKSEGFHNIYRLKSDMKLVHCRCNGVNTFIFNLIVTWACFSQEMTNNFISVLMGFLCIRQSV